MESCVDRYEGNRAYQWAIVLAETREIIGSISAVKINDNTNAVTMGYRVGRAWWHLGITTEALALVIRFFFKEAGANRIEAYQNTRNPRSGGVMRKRGMTYEGTLRKAGRDSSGACDVCCYSILAEEYLGGVV